LETPRHNPGTPPAPRAPRFPVRANRGFTLAELLVVIVVIGILAAIAIPVFLSQADKASDTALRSDLTNAAKLLQVAEANGETLPSEITAGEVVDLGSAGTFTSSQTLTVTGSGDTLCVEGTSNSGNMYSSDLGSGLRSTDCDGYLGEPTTNLISPDGIDASVFSNYPEMTFTRVVEPEAESGYALEMTIPSLPLWNSAARSRLGTADNIPTSGTGFVSIYAKTVPVEGVVEANIRPWVYTGDGTWRNLEPLDGGSVYLTDEYRRFGALVQFGTNSGGPNPGFSMTKSNSNPQVGQTTRWHSPQVELKDYATAFVIGSR